MPPPKRKTRVTKEDIIAVRKEMKISSYQRKRKIIPGPWTEVEVKFKVKPRFRANSSFYFKEPFYGKYTYTHSWHEKGWYPIIFNLETDKMQPLVKKHGMDNFIAATEKAFNEMKGPGNRPLYGNIIILEWSCDHSQDENPERRFISIKAKTNKKSIPGFMATRKGELVILQDGKNGEDDELDEDTETKDETSDD